MGRVLWINHFAVSPREGGGTRHFELGRELVTRGWSVRIAASDFHLHSRSYTRREGPQDRRVIRELVDGVEFAWLWAAPYQGNDWRRAWNWVSFARSLDRLRPPLYERPDLVIGSTPHLLAAAAAARLARRWDVPFVLEVRDLWPESLLAAGGRKGPAYQVFDGIARWLYRRADRIITLARGTSSYLETERGVDADRLVHVPNGIDPDAFGEPDRAEDGRFTVVYTGAHGPANALDVVLDAADRLRDRPGIRFRLVGDGPSKEGLIRAARELALENVEFSDPVAKDEIPRLLSRAHAGLMVLRDTPLFTFGVSPNKLFDYMAARLPVVCNVPGEVERMVKEAGAGVLARPGSPESLADAVARLAGRTEEEREAMGRSARQWVVRNHGRPILADRLDGLFREVLRR